jgi:hypothetical protein
MAENKPTKLLEQLRDELAGLSDLDDKGRDLMRTLKEDVDILLKGSGDDGSDDSLLERWQDAVDYFEVSQPSLTATISRVMTVLSNAGI